MTDRLAAADRPQAAPKAGEPSDAAGRSPMVAVTSTVRGLGPKLRTVADAR